MLTAVGDPPVETIRTVSKFQFSAERGDNSTINRYCDKLLTTCESFLENGERSL